MKSVRVFPTSVREWIEWNERLCGFAVQNPNFVYPELGSGPGFRGVIAPTFLFLSSLFAAAALETHHARVANQKLRTKTHLCDRNSL